MRITRAIAALPIAFILAGCGGNSDVTQTDDTTTAQTSDGGPSAGDTEEFFKAMSDLDQDGLEDDLAKSVSGSPAAAYVRYQSAVVDAVLDSGGSENDLSGSTFSKVDGGFKTCNQGQCVEWTEIEAKGDKIATFNVNEKPLSGIILAGGPRKFQAGDLGSAKLVAAYESQQSNQLNVLLNVSSGTNDISIGAYEAKYRSKAGRQSTASAEQSVASTDLAADSSATILLSFPRAELGGTLTLPLNSSDFMTARSAVIPIAAAG